MSSSTFHRSVDFIDFPLSTTSDDKNSSFTPLYRTTEVENLHDHINNDKQSTSPPNPSKTTKKVLTKCMTVIGDETEK
ncbi:unnamed protein product [Adineta steineri]|uniref:Uncharacterized protein n=1 Tax=Adineta steineri TaxID=433720 RepID=A0A814DVF3_9BILA|nr:unnamed protein product [Adineta steineri]CAF0955880.1 unnamed protein product [Adineta steineri]CAF0960890.1 unnamed protein product [Adineta steineri]